MATITKNRGLEGNNHARFRKGNSSNKKGGSVERVSKIREENERVNERATHRKQCVRPPPTPSLNQPVLPPPLRNYDNNNNNNNKKRTCDDNKITHGTFARFISGHVSFLLSFLLFCCLCEEEIIL